MFIGHYALGFAAKRAAPRTSLGHLFIAPSLADLLWPFFVLLGWEQVHIVGGSNPSSYSGSTVIRSLVLLLALGYYGSLFTPPPLSTNALAVGGIIFGWVFVSLAWWVDRHRGVAAVSVYPGAPPRG